APLVAGALVITPLGFSTAPALANEAEGATTTQEADETAPQSIETSQEASQDESQDTAADEQGPSTEGAEDQETPESEALESEAPVAPEALAPAAAPAALPGSPPGSDDPMPLAVTDTIAEARAKKGETVTVRGVVTAAYPTGNFRGIVI